MTIKSNITDKATNLSAQVVNGTGEKHALVVATRPLKVFNNQISFFTNDIYGADMNQNGAFGGTPILVHDGTDSILWTATDIVGGGKTTFNSDDQNHTTGGALSIKVDNSPVGDVYQIAKGSDQDLTNYTAITMWIYVDKDWKAGDSVEFYGWDTTTGTQVGTEVDLSDYFQYDTYDIWHNISIPLSDMDLTGETIDSFRILQAAAEGKAPKYYLDDIQIEETGEPIEFTIKPDKGTWLHVKNFQVVISSTQSSILADSTMPKIPYDSLLGIPLISGIKYERINADKILTGVTINNFVDLMTLNGANITGQGGDATHTWVSLDIEFNETVILKPEDDDIMMISINDELSELLYFRIGVGCKTETRTL